MNAVAAWAGILTGFAPEGLTASPFFPLDHHEGKADEGDKERKTIPMMTQETTRRPTLRARSPCTRRGEGHAEGKKPRHCLFESQGKYDRSLTRHDEDGGEVFQNACGLEEL